MATLKFCEPDSLSRLRLSAALDRSNSGFNIFDDGLEQRNCERIIDVVHSLPDARQTAVESDGLILQIHRVTPYGTAIQATVGGQREWRLFHARQRRKEPAQVPGTA